MPAHCIDIPPRSATPHPANGANDAWGAARRVLAAAGLTPQHIAFWVDEVSPAAHRMGHPVVMPGCPGCLLEHGTAVTV